MAGFFPLENGIQVTGTGFITGNGKNCQKSRMDLSIAKWNFKKQKAGKWDWYIPPSGTSFKTRVVVFN